MSKRHATTILRTAMAACLTIAFLAPSANAADPGPVLVRFDAPAGGQGFGFMMGTLVGLARLEGPIRGVDSDLSRMHGAPINDLVLAKGGRAPVDEFVAY